MENSNWKEFYIEDFAEIVNHKRIPLSTLERTNRKGSFPYYGASGIIDYVDNYIFEGKHILVSEDGENLRSRNTPIAFQADGRFWVNNHAHILKCKKDFYNEILIYYFQNLDLNPFLTGAVQPKLNKASLTKIPIILPADENHQKAIASVLSSLDDKIDLLHQQNQTLEALAETLFRQWFVEEAKEDWERKKIGDVLLTVLGGTPSTTKEEYWNGSIPWINSGEVNKFRILEGTKFITDLGLKMSNTKMLPIGTTVLAITGATLGQISLLEIDTCANQSVVGIIPNEKLSKSFVFLWVKNKINEIILNETGGAQPHINSLSLNYL